MQVVSRRVDEGLIIDDDIFVTVLDVKQNQVRLAISSPRSTPCYWEKTLYWEPEGEDGGASAQTGNLYA